MKRLIISGIPCLPEAWQALFPNDANNETKIISFIELFSEKYYKNRLLSDLIPALIDIILEFKPDQIVMHDMGVTIGILALIKARASSIFLINEIVIFNGAFTGFDVSKSNHPIRIQSMSYEEFANEIKKHGGKVDPLYKEHFTAIQVLYKQIAEKSKAKMAGSKTNHSSFSTMKTGNKIDLGSPVLILASPNDPYIHFDCLEELKLTLANSHLKIINYGHFPYSGDINSILSEIDSFYSFNRHSTCRIGAKL